MSVLRSSLLPPPLSYFQRTEYECQNKSCQHYYDKVHCYLEAHESPPNIQYCPSCGIPLRNFYLEEQYGRIVQQMRTCPGESAFQYELAFPCIELFCHIQELERLTIEKKHERRIPVAPDWADRRKTLENPGLDLVLLIAPVLFDRSALSLAEKCLSLFPLPHYSSVSFEYKRKFTDAIESFYGALPLGINVKQTDIIAGYKAQMPWAIGPESQLSWVTYVWSNFGYISRETIKNRVYFTRIEQIPKPMLLEMSSGLK